MMRAVGTIALCGAFLLGASSPATAAPDPKVQLKIVDAAKGGPTKTVWLHCAPVGGTHPNAKAACRLLEKVNGEPGRLNVSPKAACTQEVKPHAVAVIGRWHGKVVHWAKVFHNSCQVRAATGAVLAI
ncbi:SSI family serine proteinase inhibitor [Nonomuraea zeae]|uniref:Serine protease n=1 Tax=Nonomuraea zeae TaxID=1642303 RepID=A0A5S4GFM6_9ACTN|nr:SSI family serine proteinase inhibitor [Nonomuraea zeae]TMR31321.1 serine protease [Nonomuraea zeae]